MISVIIPVLNEADGIEQQVLKLKKQLPDDSEIIVVDGGSVDNTCELLQPLALELLQSEAGRAKQMNAGAAIARGDILLFMHSDTQLPAAAFTALNALAKQADKSVWGFFPLRLSGSSYLFRIIERFINLRSRLTSVATGDQCLFVSREYFRQQPYRNIPIMEDVEFSKRLRKQQAPQILSYIANTSSRRWEQNGIVRTVLLMWLLRLLYFLGVSPNRLVALYQ